MSAGQGRPAHGLQNRTEKRSDLCQSRRPLIFAPPLDGDWLWEMPTGTAGPHGMNEKSLRDLRLLSQRRSTSYRGRTEHAPRGTLCKQLDVTAQRANQVGG